MTHSLYDSSSYWLDLPLTLSPLDPHPLPTYCWTMVFCRTRLGRSRRQLQLSASAIGLWVKWPDRYICALLEFASLAVEWYWPISQSLVALLDTSMLDWYCDRSHLLCKRARGYLAALLVALYYWLLLVFACSYQHYYWSNLGNSLHCNALGVELEGIGLHPGHLLPYWVLRCNTCWLLV